LISGLRELSDFKAELDDTAAALEVIDVRLCDDAEVNNTGVWRVQRFLTLYTIDIHTIDINHNTCCNQ